MLLGLAGEGIDVGVTVVVKLVRYLEAGSAVEPTH